MADNFFNYYDFFSKIGRNNIKNSDINGKVITTITFYIKNRKWIWNKTFENMKKGMKDPLQPDKMATDTMYITKEKNKITMRYKEIMVVENGKLKLSNNTFSG